MNKNLLWMSVVALMGLGLTTGCQHKVGSETPASYTTAMVTETYLTAIDRFLTDSIGVQYAPGEVCIPSWTVIGVDDSDSTDIRVWGDYWVFNYKVAGDTLKCVSGGNHPGLMHVQQQGEHFAVTAFDAVGDGSTFLPTAKRIFGDRFEAFNKVNSDENQREQVRATAIAEYVRAHSLSVTMYQDYGWPAHPLPQQ